MSRRWSLIRLSVAALLATGLSGCALDRAGELTGDVWDVTPAPGDGTFVPAGDARADATLECPTQPGSKEWTGTVKNPTSAARDYRLTYTWTSGERETQRAELYVRDVRPGLTTNITVLAEVAPGASSCDLRVEAGPVVPNAPADDPPKVLQITGPDKEIERSAEPPDAGGPWLKTEVGTEDIDITCPLGPGRQVFRGTVRNSRLEARDYVIEVSWRKGGNFVSGDGVELAGVEPGSPRTFYVDGQAPDDADTCELRVLRGVREQSETSST